MAKTKEDFDKNRRPPHIYPDGLEVVIQRQRDPNGKAGRWNQRGTIVSKRPELDSYIVHTNGQNRLRSHLRLRPAPASEAMEETIATSDPEPESGEVNINETMEEAIATSDPGPEPGEVTDEPEAESEVVEPRRSNRPRKRPERLNLKVEILPTSQDA